MFPDISGAFSVTAEKPLALESDETASPLEAVGHEIENSSGCSTGTSGIGASTMPSTRGTEGNVCGKRGGLANGAIGGSGIGLLGPSNGAAGAGFGGTGETDITGGGNIVRLQ